MIGSMLATGMAVPCFAGEKDDGEAVLLQFLCLQKVVHLQKHLPMIQPTDFEKTGCKVVDTVVLYWYVYDKLSTEIKTGQAAHDVSCMDFIMAGNFC